jgi:ankyrin repeat protein
MAGKQPKRIPRPGVDEYGRTPLHYAAADGDANAVAAQLKGGANVNAQDDNGWTPLHFAAQGRFVEVLRTLLAAGADPNLADRHGNGPLWTAVMKDRDDYACVKLLLAHRADADRKNAYDRSPRDIGLDSEPNLKRLFDGSA